MVALSWSTAVPQRTTVTPAHLPRTEGKVEENFSDSKKKSKEVEDIILFNRNADTLVKTVTATAKKPPIAELAKAQAIAFTSLFNFGIIGEEHTANVIPLSNPNGTATVSALTEAKGSKGSGNKKQNQQNIYLGWHGGLEEVREEKVNVIA